MSLKKNLLSLSKSEPAAEIHFFDESRFGTHSKIGHGWFNKGERPSMRIKLGFENFYIYSSVHAATGEDFSLIMPQVNTQCMNIFLDHLSRKANNRQIILVMDGAAWHKSKRLKVPRNIKIIFLPPYSPELNPVERLWNYLKSKIIKNKIYESLDDLYVAVCSFIRQLDTALVKSICSARYLVC